MTDVLVVGAGPTGLTLATDLARRGVDVRIVDREPEFPAGSRGKGLSPRSLEAFDDLGVIDRILASGVTHMRHRKYQGAEVVEELDPHAQRVPAPQTPYPTGLMIPQWRVEQILRERMADFGVRVELGAQLHDFRQDAAGVTATVAGEEIRAGYLIGCDGGRSTVRKALGLTLNGHTPDTPPMAVGDVRVDGLDRDAWHQWFTPDGAMMLCPLPGTDAFQVQASPELDAGGAVLEPTLERFQQTFDRVAGVPGVRLHDLTWRSIYRVNVRMVDRLRVGRVFLAGDAAHVHPIAGGLGMNTGIQDAYNLGWKLGLGGDRLLDTYEEERLPIASWLLDITSERMDAVLAAVKTRGGGVDAVAKPELTQLALGYPWSRLSRNATSRSIGLRPGDRAPDAQLPGGRLFDLFRGPHFTLLGAETAAHKAVQAHAITPYGKDVLVLIRPDGYIGLIADAGDTASVTGYLDALH